MSPAALSGRQVRDTCFHSGRESQSFLSHTPPSERPEHGGRTGARLGLVLSLPEPGVGTGRGLRAAPQSPGSHRLRCPQLNPTGKIKPTAERDDLVKIEICLRTVTGENRFSPILCRLPSPSKKCLGNSNHRKQNNQGRSVRGQGLGAGQADPSHSHSSHRGWDRDGKGWVRSGQDGTGHSCLPRHGVSPKAAATPQGSRCREHWGAVGQTPGQRDGQQVGGQGEA